MAGSILVVAIVLLFIVITFGATSSAFECNGKLTDVNLDKPAILYFKLNEYRWFILWAKNNGMVNVEIPQIYVGSYNVQRVLDQYQLFDLENNFKGNYSALSKTISLQTNQGFFDGNCKRIDS